MGADMAGYQIWCEVSISGFLEILQENEARLSDEKKEEHVKMLATVAELEHSKEKQ